MDQNFKSRGFTDIIDISLNDELKNLQNLIYEKTKNLLVKHEQKLPLSEKIQLQLKNVPPKDFWSDLMKDINDSMELKKLINSEGIKLAFKKIFENPELFGISTFRARFPNQQRAVYNWHQDEGTWYLSKNKNNLNKYPATLWFSVNGATSKDSIQLVSFSHQKKLYSHNYIKGQGFFSIKKNKLVDSTKINTIEAKPSQAVIFHPLSLHRSVPQEKINLRPRYSVDIRYFDKNFKPNFSIDVVFKLKKFLRNFY